LITARPIRIWLERLGLLRLERLGRLERLAWLERPGRIWLRLILRWPILRWLRLTNARPTGIRIGPVQILAD
jgi:hypothetical protein